MVTPTGARSARPAAATPAPTPDRDLPGLFAALVRLRRSWCAEIDGDLRGVHDLSLDGFDLMAAVAEFPGGRDRGDLAAELGLADAAIDAAVVQLQAAGLVAPRSGGRPVVCLTLRGRRELARAQRTIEQALAGRIEARDAIVLRAALESIHASSAARWGAPFGVR
jgi:DNA-binding MarR family transcriptional regulator